MDQGIIRTLKSNFRKNLVLKIIHTLDKNSVEKTNKPNITMLDAILMIYDAWNKVTQTTIDNCFRHAGFVRENLDCPSTSSSAQFDDEDDLPLAVWAKALENEIPISSEELEEYAAIDEFVETCEEPSDENIVQNIIDEGQDSDTESEAEEFDVIPSVSDALKAAEVLTKFVHLQLTDDVLKNSMSKLNSAVRDSFYKEKANLKQAKITDFLI